MTLPRLCVPVLLSLLLLGCGPDRRGGTGGSGGDPTGGQDDDDDAGTVAAPVDILMVVDNSSSMQEIQSEIQVEFQAVLESLTAASVDFQLGVTTTDIESPGNGRQGNIRSVGNIGSGDCGPTLIEDGGGDDGARLFADLVDVGTEGSGSETGITAAAFALCKSQGAEFWDGLAARADADPVKLLCSNVPESERTCNAGFVREGADTAIIVVSDEGDDSYRSGQFPPLDWTSDCVADNLEDPVFGECACRVSWWVEFFAAIGADVRFFNIGPTHQVGATTPLCGEEVELNGPCNPFGADVCSIDFYQQSSCLTGGDFFPIERTQSGEPSSCLITDFSLVAASISAALGG